MLCTIRHVILSGVRSTKSKNLRIMMTFAVKSVPRSFDSLTLAQDDMLRQLFDKLKFENITHYLGMVMVSTISSSVSRRSDTAEIPLD